MSEAVEPTESGVPFDPAETARLAALPELVIVVGPTASGKTELAVRLARQSGGEVISADSVQIYRYFDIGSGKPTDAERQGVPHHLIDVAEPADEFDASVFASKAEACIADVRSRGRQPILCGGTFLWVRALLYGLAPAPPKDEILRAQHQRFAERHGRPALHARLQQIDVDSYQRLMPNDLVRVSRALEVYELTGTPLSAFHRAHGFARPRHRALMLGIRHERSELHARIQARVRGMLRLGWLDEVRELLARGFGETRPMSSVGYAQVKAAVSSDEPVDEAALLERIAQVTRVFSRRQRTWLREQPVHWLDAAELQARDVNGLFEQLRAGPAK